MQNKIVRIIVGVIAFAVGVGSLYSLYIDSNYFTTKKEGRADILKIQDQGPQEPYLIYIAYNNEYTSKKVECSVELESSYIAQLKHNNQPGSASRVFYSKGFPQKAYLADYKSPKAGILVFDVIMVILMGIAVYASIYPTRRVVY